MGNKPKKIRMDAQLAYRLSQEERESLMQIADELRLKPATVVGIVVNEYVKARKEHGVRLTWPPELNYYKTGIEE